MMNIFLKAKHWQLFILTFGLPMIFQVFVMSSMILGIENQTEPEVTSMLSFMAFFPLVMLVFVIVYYGWFWSVAIALQNKLPEDVSMKVKKFKIFFFIPFIYILLLILIIAVAISGLFPSYINQDFNIIISIIAAIIPLHLFSMFCILYSMYFVAKTIKTVELQKEVKFEDFVGEFFMIWFYPVGVWILQPKINKMIEE